MMQSTSHYADHILRQLDHLENRQHLSVEEKIISYLEQCGPITSLFQFAVVRLGIAYAWAWIIVQRLEADGSITVERSPGRPLTIRRN
jgi:molybdenum-dependent DNA-binding transcriptional regulator ModE